MPKIKYLDNDLRNIANDDVMKYIPLVKSIIKKRFRGGSLSYDEKLNAGLIGVAFGLKRYNPDCNKSLVSWIYYYASDYIRNEIQKTKKYQPALSNPEYATLGVTQDNQFEQLEIQEEFNIVQENLNCLDNRSKKILRWRYLKGKSYVDIAKRLGVSKQRVFQICQDALFVLREKITNQ